MQLIGEEATQHRAENARAHEHDGGPALNYRPFLGRQQIGNDRLRDWQQAAAANTLQPARKDQDPDRRRQRTGDRTADENSKTPEKNNNPAEETENVAKKRSW